MTTRENSIPTDSSFFEGPEKKFEILTSPRCPSFRSYGRARWEAIVRIAGAEILSHISNSHCDSYLLSESSLFVWDYRVLMITCGRTTLAHAASQLLEGLKPEDIEFFIYERKNEHFPELQKLSFKDDVELLRGFIEGETHRFGQIEEHHVYLFQMKSTHTPDPSDRTLEILMHGIDPEVSGLFINNSLEGQHQKDWIRETLEVRELFPGFVIDDYLFEPHGYSLNAIKGNFYYTLHVTPQSEGSYVSFETNYCTHGKSKEMAEKILKMFKPEHSDVLFFSPDKQKLPLHSSFSAKKMIDQDLEGGFSVNYNQIKFNRHHASLLDLDLR